MSTIKVIVHGLGFITLNHHLPVLAKMPEVKVVGVVSRSEKHAKEVAEKYKAHPYTSLEEALEKEKPDFVDICTETFRHKEDALLSINHEVNVFLEKPIALKLKDAKEIIDAAKRKGVLLMVGHVLRFWPEYVRIKEAVEDGKIGEPSIARAYRYVPFPAWSFKEWHKDITKSGGVFVDLSIHDVDFLRWVLGEVDEVFARGGVYGIDGTAHTHVHALLKFKNGAIAYVEGSWIIPQSHKFYTYFEIAGSKGLLTVDYRTTAGLAIYKDDYLMWTPHVRDGYYLELEAFAKAIKTGGESPLPGEEAMKSLEVTLAAIKSIREKRPIKLPLEEEVL